MDQENLRKTCKERFPKNGDRLFRAIMDLHYKDFCATTGWSDHEVSLSKSCRKRGRIFQLSDDYQHIVMPSGELRSIESLTYADVSRHLPDSHFNQEEPHYHCDCDKLN